MYTTSANRRLSRSAGQINTKPRSGNARATSRANRTIWVPLVLLDTKTSGFFPYRSRTGAAIPAALRAARTRKRCQGLRRSIWRFGTRRWYLQSHAIEKRRPPSRVVATERSPTDPEAPDAAASPFPRAPEGRGIPWSRESSRAPIVPRHQPSATYCRPCR